MDWLPITVPYSLFSKIRIDDVGKVRDNRRGVADGSSVGAGAGVCVGTGGVGWRRRAGRVLLKAAGPQRPSVGFPVLPAQHSRLAAHDQQKGRETPQVNGLAGTKSALQSRRSTEQHDDQPHRTPPPTCAPVDVIVGICRGLAAVTLGRRVGRDGRDQGGHQGGIQWWASVAGVAVAGASTIGSTAPGESLT